MKLVAYIRVSTEVQGVSGLGLDAQLSQIHEYARRKNAQIIETFVEIESGAKSDRPKLLSALALCKRQKVPLVVSKLDRLARNVGFLESLRASKVKFIFVDNEGANDMVIQILSAVAQAESEAVKKRTKEALAEKKKEGALLGSARKGHWDGLEHKRLLGSKKGLKKIREKVRSVTLSKGPKLKEMRDNGMTLQQIADEMNKQNDLRGPFLEWNAMQVKRTLDRFEKGK